MRDDGLLKKPKTTDEALHQNHSAYFVPGLERGLHVLETVGESDKPMTISEIGRAIGVSRSSAFRLVYTLRQMGFLKAVYDDRAFELFGGGPVAGGIHERGEIIVGHRVDAEPVRAERDLVHRTLAVVRVTLRVVRTHREGAAGDVDELDPRRRSHVGVGRRGSAVRLEMP